MNDPLHRWLAYFDRSSPPELLEEIIAMDTTIRMASAKHAFVMQDDEAYETYWMRLKAQMDLSSQLQYAKDEGMAEGIEQGITQGRIVEKLEIARRMKEMGDPIEKICVITGLSLEALEELGIRN